MSTESSNSINRLTKLRECTTCRGEGNYDCEGEDCFGTGLGPTVHYTTVKDGPPTCIELDPKVSTKADEVSCKHCLSVIHQRQNMDMGDWLK